MSSSRGAARGPGPDGAGRELREAVRALVLAHGLLGEGRRPCGVALPTPHAWALLELRRQQPMTVSELASRLNIDRTNVSRLCARMQANGELAREVHPGDGRARLLRLTPHGARVAAAVEASSAAHFDAIVQHLGGPAAAIVDALNRLAGAMRRTSTAAPEERRQA